jgi:prepilin-type N-terminal cleavage/methylation domain-containing protein
MASVRTSPTPSRKVRGFTLIELMVVVVIIAVLAVIAVPLFSARMQSRRIFQVAGRMADLYRGSRTRALARGAAVVVQLNQGDYSLQVLEGVQGTDYATASGKATCGNLPTRGCLTNNWGDLGSSSRIGTARVIEGMGHEAIKTTYAVGLGAPSSGTDPVNLCFSPAGRTYLNIGTTYTPESWQLLTSAVTIEVSNTNPSSTTPRSYKVIVMPNGTARLAL